MANKLEDCSENMGNGQEGGRKIAAKAYLKHPVLNSLQWWD